MAGAGKLHERVAFERRADVPDGYGNEASGPWQEQFQAAARIKPLRGGESVMASRLSGKQPVIITVRVSSKTRQATPDWRIRDVRSGTVFNIRAIADTEERRMYLDLVCEAGVGI